MSSPFECRRVRVEGRVQGVGFREACLARAQSLGVAGWVRNRPDGSVEVLVQGTGPAVDALLAWLQVGPAAARVMKVSAQPEQPVPGLAGFERRATG